MYLYNKPVILNLKEYTYLCTNKWNAYSNRWKDLTIALNYKIFIQYKLIYFKRTFDSHTWSSLISFFSKIFLRSVQVLHFHNVQILYIKQSSLHFNHLYSSHAYIRINCCFSSIHPLVLLALLLKSIVASSSVPPQLHQASIHLQDLSFCSLLIRSQIINWTNQVLISKV